MYKIFDMRTCGLSHQIKGPVIVNLTILQLKPDLANFTVVGPLIWCDNPHVRLSKILYINNNDFHNLGRSQMCAGGCCYFRPSKPHSGTLWNVSRNSVNNSIVHPVNIPPVAAMRSDTFSIKSRSKLVNLKSNLRSNVEIFSVQTPAELVWGCGWPLSLWFE